MFDNPQASPGAGGSQVGSVTRPNREQGGRSRETARKSMSFIGDPRLEPAFLVYLSECNRGVTLRMHCVMVVAWTVGLLKTILILAQTHYSPEKSQEGLHSGYMLALTQLCIVLHEFVHLPYLFSLKKKHLVMQETVKAKLHALLHLIVLAVVLLSKDDLPNSPSHVYATIFCSFLSILDMIPLRSLIKIHIVKLGVFLILELYTIFTGSFTIKTIMTHFGLVALLGTMVPLWLAASTECKQRISFLTDCNKTWANLGPIWSKLCVILASDDAVRLYS